MASEPSGYIEQEQRRPSDWAFRKSPCHIFPAADRTWLHRYPMDRVVAFPSSSKAVSSEPSGLNRTTAKSPDALPAATIFPSDCNVIALKLELGTPAGARPLVPKSISLEPSAFSLASVKFPNVPPPRMIFSSGRTAACYRKPCYNVTMRRIRTIRRVYLGIAAKDDAWNFPKIAFRPAQTYRSLVGQFCSLFQINLRCHLPSLDNSIRYRPSNDATPATTSAACKDPTANHGANISLSLNPSRWCFITLSGYGRGDDVLPGDRGAMFFPAGCWMQTVFRLQTYDHDAEPCDGRARCYCNVFKFGKGAREVCDKRVWRPQFPVIIGRRMGQSFGPLHPGA